MAKTFDRILVEQERAFLLLHAQTVLTVDLDEGVIPAPFSILTFPARVLAGGRPQRRMRQSFVQLDEGDEPEAPPPLTPHYSSRALLAQLIDDEATRPTVRSATRADVRQLGDALDKLQQHLDRSHSNGAAADGALAADEVAAADGVAELASTSSAAPASLAARPKVQRYAGFREDANRLVFHYADRFTALGEARPRLLTLVSSSSTGPLCVENTRECRLIDEP